MEGQAVTWEGDRKAGQMAGVFLEGNKEADPKRGAGLEGDQEAGLAVKEGPLLGPCRRPAAKTEALWRSGWQQMQGPCVGRAEDWRQRQNPTGSQAADLRWNPSGGWAGG